MQYRLKKFLFFITLSFLLSCSTEKPADVTRQMPSDAENNTIQELQKPPVSTKMDSYLLEITPLDAAINSTLNLDIIFRKFLQYASKDLNYHLQKMSGTALEIVQTENPAEVKAPAVVLGDLADHFLWTTSSNGTESSSSSGSLR